MRLLRFEASVVQASPMEHGVVRDCRSMCEPDELPVALGKTECAGDLHRLLSNTDSEEGRK